MLDIISFIAAIILVFIVYALLFFAPYPVLYYSLKSGKKVGIAIVVVSTGILLVFNSVGVAFYLLECGICALLLAEFLGRGMGFFKTLTYTLAINLLILVALFLGYSFLQSVDIHATIIKGIHTVVSQIDVINQKNGLKGDDLAAVHQYMVQTADFVSTTYPSLIVVLLGAIGGLNLLLLKKNVNRLPRQPYFEDLSKFRNPDQLVWVLIVSGFVLLINNALVTTTSLNILVVTLFFYFIQGLSITTCFFNRLLIPRFFRVMFYIMTVQFYIMLVVAALGVFDLWCDFRTPKKQENL